MKIKSWVYLYVWGAIVPPIRLPPSVQTKIADDRIKYSYDGERASIKHIWDNIWLDILVGMIVLFFASFFFIYGLAIAIGSEAFTAIMIIFVAILVVVAYLAIRKSRE